MNFTQSGPFERRVIDFLMQIYPEIDIESLNMEDFIDAFTAPSYKGMCPDVGDYERLEFLGDAVLDLISAEDLVRSSSGKEGFMTEKRKQSVNNETLATVFDYLKMEKLVRIPPNFGLSTKIRADFVEALFGALYLNISFKDVKNIWSKTNSPANSPNLNENFEFNTLKMERGIEIEAKNPKSVLQEFAQKMGLDLPKYEEISREGPVDSPTFNIKVSMYFKSANKTINLTANAIAKTKKKGEIECARILCQRLNLLYENF